MRCTKQRRKPELPAYNIEKSDDHYRITLALAGFRQEGLDIQLEGHAPDGERRTRRNSQPENEPKWLHQGWSCSLLA